MWQIFFNMSQQTNIKTRIQFGWFPFSFFFFVAPLIRRGQNMIPTLLLFFFFWSFIFFCSARTHAHTKTHTYKELITTAKTKGESRLVTIAVARNTPRIITCTTTLFPNVFFLFFFFLPAQTTASTVRQSTEPLQ